VSLHEQVDAGRERPRLHLEQADGADVLLPAEDQFRLFLALGLVTPDGQRDGHEHRHHGQRHEPRRRTLTP
jgi:hypothetical protein